MTHFIQKSKRYEDIALFSNKPSQRRSLAKICATLVIALTGLVGLQSANAVEKLSVSGSQVLVGGQAEGMAGNSFFWTNNTWGGAPFYNRDTVRWLKQDWNSRIVRAAMGPSDFRSERDDHGLAFSVSKEAGHEGRQEEQHHVPGRSGRRSGPRWDWRRATGRDVNRGDLEDQRNI